MIRHHGPISGIAAYGGQYVATAGYDNQVILWQAADRRPIARAVHDHLANQVAFSPDGTRLLTSSSDYTARLWSVPDLKLLAVFSDQKDDVEMSAFHPTRPWVATASRDSMVRAYDFTGMLIARFEGHRADVISVGWSADGEELISSSDDGTVKRWSLTDGLIRDLDLGGVETDTIALCPDGVVFAGNDEGEIIRITGTEVRAFPAHRAGIKRLIRNPRTGALVSLSYDRTLRIWDTARELEPVSATTFPAEVWARSCDFLDDRTLVFATFGSTYATYHADQDRWDVTGIEETAAVNAVLVSEGRTYTIGDAGRLRADGTPVASLGSLCNFLADAGGLLLTGGQLGRLFDARSGAVLHTHRSPLNCAAVATVDGLTHVVVGTYTGEGLLFAVHPDHRAELVGTLPLHANAVKGVAVSGDTLFSVCADTAASWFSLGERREIARRSAAHDKIANGCAVLADGRFASVSRDLLLRLWDGEQAHTVPTPHDHSIKCVAAESAGPCVATGSYSGMIAVYDTSAETWTKVLRPTTAGISSLHYDARRSLFLASSYDGMVYEVRA